MARILGSPAERHAVRKGRHGGSHRSRSCGLLSPGAWCREAIPAESAAVRVASLPTSAGCGGPLWSGLLATAVSCPVRAAPARPAAHEAGAGCSHVQGPRWQTAASRRHRKGLSPRARPPGRFLSSNASHGAGARVGRLFSSGMGGRAGTLPCSSDAGPRLGSPFAAWCWAARETLGR